MIILSQVKFFAIKVVIKTYRIRAKMNSIINSKLHTESQFQKKNLAKRSVIDDESNDEMMIKLL